MTSTTITRGVLAAAGIALLLRGGFIALHTIQPEQWPEILIWFAGGIVAHDAVIAPLTLLLGRIFRPGPVIAAGWMALGVALILTYPLLKGAEVRRNPTIIPDAPVAGLAPALAVVAVGLLLAWAVRRVRSSRQRVGSRADRENR